MGFSWENAGPKLQFRNSELLWVDVPAWKYFLAKGTEVIHGLLVFVGISYGVLMVAQKFLKQRQGEQL